MSASKVDTASLRASAPGKLMLAGEYAILEGAEAVVMAVGRRVVARVGGSPEPLSPFLAAARDLLAAEFGPNAPAARAAAAIAVDSAALALPGGPKLGLGSSAAATVAGLACALAAAGESPSPERLCGFAQRAHAAAQGGRGSGADIAASSFGGLLVARAATHGGACRRLALPRDLKLVATFTGRAAHTPTLMRAAARARDGDPAAYAAAMGALGDASAALAAAIDGGDARACVAAIDRGAAAIAELDASVDAELVLPAHRLIAEAARHRGGAAKPTGAAGGDLALAAFADPGAAEAFLDEMTSRQMHAFAVSPDTGVEVHRGPGALASG